MRILATSDLHGRLPEIEPCDVLVLAGDICPDFPDKAGKYTLLDKGGSQQADWLNTTFRDWITPIAGRGTAVVAIWGNHDFVGEKWSSFDVNLPWNLLQDDGVRIDGVTFWGTPWVPGLKRWAFYAGPDALKARSEMIPEGVDVLISHGPPRGYGDRLCDFHASLHAPDPRNIGDPYLHTELHRIAPAFVICGHIHEDRGVHRHPSGAVVHNVSHVDCNYEDPSPPTEIIMAGSVADLSLASW